MPTKLLHRVAAQRVVARLDAVAIEQRVDLAQPKRPLSLEPFGDSRLVLRDLGPFRAPVGQRACLHALCDLVHLRFRQLAIVRQRELSGDRDVARGRVAIDARLSCDSPVAMPRQPAAKHFFHVDHG